jgi:transcriptional regulator with XRE-family HTH domain
MRLPTEVALSAAARTRATATETTDTAAPVDLDVAYDPKADITRLSVRVRLARLHAKLSKAELARHVGVCLSAAVQWELPHGTSPTVTNLAKIATASGVAFEWLATGRGSPKLAPALQGIVALDDIDFEIRLLVAMRAAPRDQRERLVEFARTLVES